MKKVFLLTKMLALFAVASNAQYLQTFETTSLATLVNDSGWQASGVVIGNNNKLTGSKELETVLLNTSTSVSTYLVTYLYKGQGYNQIDFQHVINNASGKDIDLIITAMDSVGVTINSFTYTYKNASVVTSTWSFNTYSSYKLKFEWSGAKVSSGSKAFLDMVFVNSPFIPLPVKLLDFSSETHETGTAIKWISAEESNMNRYELFKSVDGKSYVKIAELAANGYGDQLNHYQYVDVNINASAFYKIKMVDNDGSFAWSNIISVNGNTAALSSRAYPVPAADMLFVENSEEISNANLMIMDASGKVIRTIPAGTMESGAVTSLNISELSSGVYYIQFSNADQASKPVRFIKY